MAPGETHRGAGAAQAPSRKFAGQGASQGHSRDLSDTPPLHEGRAGGWPSITCCGWDLPSQGPVPSVLDKGQSRLCHLCSAWLEEETPASGSRMHVVAGCVLRPVPHCLCLAFTGYSSSCRREALLPLGFPQGREGALVHWSQHQDACRHTRENKWPSWQSSCLWIT